MKKVYEARDLIEAQMLKDYLETYGFECIIKGDLLLGGIGELPADSYPSIWLIHEEDYERVRERVRNFEQDRKDDQMFDNVWYCASCGEVIEAQFTQCWNCGAIRSR